MLAVMSTPSTGTKNLGPAAFHANRRALLDAAHEVFTTRGAAAPMSAVATAAGVSQAVLYRHFPTRESLADAISDQKVDELAALAEPLDADAYSRVLHGLIEAMVQEVELVTIVVSARHRPAEGQQQRLEALIARTLRATTDPPEDIEAATARAMLAVHMIYGAVVIAEPADRSAAARAAVRMLPEGLVPQAR